MKTLIPTYVEVSFGNACNFKCMYCAPHISSKWMEEIKQHGLIPTSDRYNNLEWIESQGQMPIPNNPTQSISRSVLEMVASTLQEFTHLE